MFPKTRLSRLRRSAGLRRLARETDVPARCLIAPLFVVEGNAIRKEIPSMPGQYHLSVDRLIEEASELADLNIGGILLFGQTRRKDARAGGAQTLIPQALRKLKRALADRMVVIADVCLCAYTDSGHCGLLDDAHGGIDNDASLLRLAEVAVAYTQAGADIVAPSDMMDGRVGALRSALDREGFSRTPVLSYAAKYASAFYGPFRDAVSSAPKKGEGDRRGYQMDPANVREALREIRADLDEGADIVMIKPALAYLDVIRAARGAVDCPIAAYSVSGEYAMVKAAARAGWIDEEQTVREILTSIRRAGADLLCTYWARSAAGWR